MAICMYVVALVNRISFDEGEEMNKVIDAIKQSFTICRPFCSWDSSDGDTAAVCNFHKEQRILSPKHEVQQEHFDTLS